MNDIDDFLAVAATIFVAVAVAGLMILLTYLEQTLFADPKPRPRHGGREPAAMGRASRREQE